MPKLAKKMAKRTAEAEEPKDGFEPLPAGKYIVTLDEVEDRKSQAGNAMWGIRVTDIFDLEGNEQPGSLFTNLVMPGDDSEVPDDYEGNPKSKKSLEDQWINRNAFLSGKIKQFFEAFGFTTDSDTDEMIGERAVASVTIETIQAGKRKGQQGNQISAFHSLDSVDHEDVGDGDTEDDF